MDTPRKMWQRTVQHGGCKDVGSWERGGCEQSKMKERIIMSFPGGGIKGP